MQKQLQRGVGWMSAAKSTDGMVDFAALIQPTN